MKSVLLVSGLIVGTGLALLVPFLMASTRGPIIAIDDLKDTYEVGENITFTVNVEGQLDRHCNYHTFPEVTIQNEDKENVYENRAIYLGISCDPNPSFISSHWTYPIQRDHEAWGINSTKENISINRTGTYALIVSFDKEKITRQFVVASYMSPPQLFPSALEPLERDKISELNVVDVIR
jgi:hypothetical protein